MPRLRALLASAEARVLELEAALGRSEGSVALLMKNAAGDDATRSRLESELEASHRELDTVAYVTAHDLKAPLRGIANLSTWIEEDLDEVMTPGSREHMRLLRGRVHRLEGLIDGILSYARASRQTTQPQLVDVARLLRDVCALLSPTGAATFSLGPMPVLVTERAALEQVFLHLLGNALKHSGKANARVEVTARAQGAFWQFTVRDDGPGISPEFRERVWGIFQTLEPRDKVEGTGIGLALVRKIVETRGGRAWIEDAAPGATFCFTWERSREGSVR